MYSIWMLTVCSDIEQNEGKETHDTKLFHFIVFCGTLLYVHSRKMY